MTKKDDILTISDLARMGHDLSAKAGQLPFQCFGGWDHGKSARATLKSIEKDIETFRKAITVVRRNERRSVRAEQRAEFNYLAKELGIRVRA